MFDQVKKQLDVGYEYLGEHEGKNIAAPPASSHVTPGPRDPTVRSLLPPFFLRQPSRGPIITQGR